MLQVARRHVVATMSMMPMPSGRFTTKPCQACVAPCLTRPACVEPVSNRNAEARARHPRVRAAHVAMTPAAVMIAQWPSCKV